tara:strand:- start:628 stop:1161 length:534 start_codon:yes stop_codon:yes gene_type:complete
LIPFVGFGQETESEPLYKMDITDSKTNLITFEEVIPVEGVSSTELYSELKEWFVTRFNNAEGVLHMDDRESGKLIGKTFTNIQVGSLDVRRTEFTIKILIREGRIKYTLTDFVMNLQIQYSEPMPLEEIIVDNLYKKSGKVMKKWATYKEELIKFAQLISSDLKESVKDLSTKGDDW